MHMCERLWSVQLVRLQFIRLDWLIIVRIYICMRKREREEDKCLYLSALLDYGSFVFVFDRFNPNTREEVVLSHCPSRRVVEQYSFFVSYLTSLHVSCHFNLIRTSNEDWYETLIKCTWQYSSIQGKCQWWNKYTIARRYSFLHTFRFHYYIITRFVQYGQRSFLLRNVVMMVIDLSNWICFVLVDRKYRTEQRAATSSFFPFFLLLITSRLNISSSLPPMQASDFFSPPPIVY